MCLGCEIVDDGEVVVRHPGIPGASQRRTYDQKHARREGHARQRAGFVGVALSRLIDEPQHIEAWKRGAEGEERVGRRLEKLLQDSGVKLLHDRRMPGKGAANIDHIAIGPGGITVIDTKNCRGKVRVDRVGGLFIPRQDRLRINGRQRTGLAKGVEHQVAAVHRVVADGSIGIRGALCFADTDGLPWFRSLSVDGIVVDGPKPVAKLARRAGPLTSEQVEAWWARLDRRLPVA